MNLNHDIFPDLQTVWEQQYANQRGWLHEQKREALSIFNKLGLPNKSLEEFRYTDLNAIGENLPEWLTQPAQGDVSTADSELEIADAIKICFVDGRFNTELSSDLPNGVLAGNTEELARDHPELMQNYWGLQANNNDSGLISLNSAFANATVIIALEANVKLRQPIHINFIGALAETSIQPRIFINLADASEATVVEQYTSSASRIVNAVTEISCGPESKLSYCKLQEEDTSAWHTATQYVNVSHDARFCSTHIDLGAKLARNDLRIRLTGTHAHADCNGVFMADGKRHSESRINVAHAAPHTTSRERFRGVLTDKARGVFNGCIHVAQAAQKTSAELTNRNLLLSQGAEINTKPELEIYADDVKCAHGSTTGQLDANAMFYLLSRGVAPAEARNMLVQAFASEMVNQIDIQPIGEKVRTALAKLGTAA